MNLLKGSSWRKWDLQVQTILDDRYISIQEYYGKIKTAFPDKWKEYVDKVGGEQNAILYDSKEYFNDTKIDVKTRCTNYVRNLFSYVSVFNSEVGVIGISDHNYHHDYLIDEFINYSKNSNLKALAGVEINASGVHMLVFFENPPYSKTTYSEGIKTFLSQIEVHQPKNKGTLTVSGKSVTDVIDVITKQNGIYIFPHCNSNNGLFQERGKTDRTHLSDIFNLKNRILLQSSSKENAVKTQNYILGSDILNSESIFSISQDSRCLDEIAKPDDKGNYTWIKADPTFEGLRQVLYEPKEKICIQEINPYNEIDKKFFSHINIDDDIYLFEDDNDLQLAKYEIPLNQGLVSIIGGRGEGKSMLVDYLSAVFKKGTKRSFIPNDKFKINYTKSSLSKENSTYVADSLDENLDYLYVPQNELKQVTDPETPEKLKEHLFKLLNIEEVRFDSQLDSKVLNSLKEILNFKEWLLETNDKGIYINSKKKINDELKNINELVDNLSTLETKSKIENFTENLSQIQSYLSEIEKIKSFKEDIISFDKKFKETNNKLRRPIREFDANNLKNDLKSRERFYNAIINKYKKKNFGTSQSIRSFYKGDIESLLQDSEAYQIKKSTLEGQIQAHKEKISEAFSEKKNLLGLVKEINSEYNNHSDEIDKKWKDFESTKFNTQEKKQIFSDLISSCGIEIKGEIYFNKVEFYKGLRNQINGTKWRTKNSPGEVENYFKINDFKSFYEFINTRLLKDFKDRNEYYYDAFLEYFLLNKNRSNYLKVMPIIYYKGKTLDKLSGGEKGTLYLRIKFATGLFNTPIIIDQPEDELDNLFITNELVSLLKRIRKYRQVILVTHNANIVVNSDSDQVIVASNLDGKISYISGSLENPEINNKICKILEGGKSAFKKRRNKYSEVD